MTQSHCESSPGSSDECRLSAGWPPTLRPSQSTWALSPPKIGSYHPHPPSPLLFYSFYRPTKGGRLSRPRHCSKGAQPVLKAVYRSTCRDRHNCQWGGVLSHRSQTRQPLGHGDLCVIAAAGGDGGGRRQRREPRPRGTP